MFTVDRRRLAPALWLAAGMAIGAAGPALAQLVLPQGEFTCLVTVEWRSGCDKPAFDAYSRGDAAVRGKALLDFEAYQKCLAAQADSDAHYASQAVTDSAQHELEVVRNEGRAYGFPIE